MNILSLFLPEARSIFEKPREFLTSPSAAICARALLIREADDEHSSIPCRYDSQAVSVPEADEYGMLNTGDLRVPLSPIEVMPDDSPQSHFLP